MKTYTVDEMKAILAEHAKWMRGEGGSRADLSGAYLARANLTDADLTDANLTDANLTYANLTYADLTYANLTYADLSGAYLTYANLSGADLNHANLTDANLTYANLTYANLTDANLTDANLTYAYLTDANLTDANLNHAKNIPAFQLCEGDLIVYKKVQGKIVTLAISKTTKRTASIIGRKCRSESALVLEIEGHQPVQSNGCGNGVPTLYKEGKEVRPDSYDDDFRVECSHGIHWFQTRKEAEDWSK